MKFFKPIADKIKAAQRLNSIKALHTVLKDKEFQQFVLDLNRQGQLYDEGINSQSEALKTIGGDYSKKTKAIKQAKGQPINRVTLFDTGDFYKSFAINPTVDGFDIVADTLKEDQDLIDRWGKEILGLTDDSLNEVVFRIVPLLQDYLRKQLKL